MVVIVILGIFVLLFFLVRYKGKKNLEANIAAEQHDVFEEMASFQNTIDYHGTTYQYRKDIVNILCIGVDKEEAMWERDDDGGSVGQADAVFLVSLDFEHSNIRILAIPRDTMVSIVACDENGNEMGAFTGQLALQYAYADGQEKSCSLVIGQVADILKNEVPINGYVAMNLSCIGTVNDAVGGVTVEMDDDYTLYNAKFKKGATVHLQGEEAQEFVQEADKRWLCMLFGEPYEAKCQGKGFGSAVHVYNEDGEEILTYTGGVGWQAKETKAETKVNSALKTTYYEAYSAERKVNFNGRVNRCLQ